MTSHYFIILRKSQGFESVLHPSPWMSKLIKSNRLILPPFPNRTFTMLLSSAITFTHLQPYMFSLILVVLVYYVSRALKARQATKLQVPIVGVFADQWFSTLRARLRYIQHGGQLILGRAIYKGAMKQALRRQ